MEPDELIGATVAVYPLQPEADATVHRAIDALAAAGVEAQVGPMTTLVTGTADAVFRSLRAAYDSAAASGGVVMHATVSNACPLPAPDGS
jgi:uncharacterized protein YqgV (UPF0045/DUF77 family)